MHCASCGVENPAGKKFCEECGTEFIPACPSCGAEVRPTAKFCGDCGLALLTSTRPVAPTTHPPSTTTTLQDSHSSRGLSTADAERRQLTVMFCDLVGSTALAEQLDPEELREIVRAYQDLCAQVIQRYEGYIAQYLGDGLLVYFGYPRAHEDDAARAVRAGLGIRAALQALNHRFIHPVQVRIGIHTGPVVVGDIGQGGKREQLALGETPNIAARLQGLAEPGTVVISEATRRLVAGLFESQTLGLQAVKGLSTPLSLYRVVGESAVQSRFAATATHGLTPLVGRDHEVALLLERWEWAKEGEGQVVLLSGEPGIGKSRLVQELKERIDKEEATRIELQCSPYYQHSAFYPVIEHLSRALQFQHEETPQSKLDKLSSALVEYRFPQPDTAALLAALLSLPQPAGVPPLHFSPQRQKQKALEALVAWLVEEAEQRIVCMTWEDLQWADPSTLELLQLLIEQVPTSRLYLLLTFRPEFTPPWGTRSHISQLTLSRLGRRQVEAMVERVARGKALPTEVVQHIVAKTDGVPLFVEELTKMVVEAAADGGTPLAAPFSVLGIPATLHGALMARLDRLHTAKEIAQWGATLGREFTYELLQAISPLDEASLQRGLAQLVEAELVYQRGLPPHARYLFKHALVQDTAYQSILKSKRQQLHQQIAHVLKERFPETKDTQPSTCVNRKPCLSQILSLLW